MSDLCTCAQFCCDTDDEIGVCKGLPVKPEPPLVKVVLVHRDSYKDAGSVHAE